MAAARPARVRRFDCGGRSYWVKRRETLSLRMRLQKGAAGRAFDAERAALETPRARGAPVLPVLAEGEDFLVTPDCGATLRALLKDPEVADDTRRAAFGAAGRALARLHGAGLSHGRPAVKDIAGTAAPSPSSILSATTANATPPRAMPATW